MKFELIEIESTSNSSACFPDFFDDCMPNSGCEECVPVFDEIPKDDNEE